MIPEAGHFLLWLALGTALVLAVVPLVGAARGNVAWMALARPAALLQFVFVLGAFACLAAAFVNHDFSVDYVASNSNSALPLYY
ncbi:MAG: c-type cytochrome biogenesis protein CcmF, partial [Luteimonas sp.]|nr:c-type cytochrome biogenesis protein CcmF [Luteimonas sp.]